MPRQETASESVDAEVCLPGVATVDLQRTRDAILLGANGFGDLFRRLPDERVERHVLELRRQLGHNYVDVFSESVVGPLER